MHMAVVAVPAALVNHERATTDRRVVDPSRMLDMIVALIALFFFLPLMLIIAALIYLTDRGPIFFAHRRIGKSGRHFHCLKFRSMAVDAEVLLSDLLATDPAARAEWARDQKLKHDPRVTQVGAFLRKSSLDELPQILNVLRGDMALVGPRPIVEAEALRYGRYFAHYCSVRPGITGLWQISGRNNVSYRRRIAFDVAYSRSRSALFDIKILALTVPSVVIARGSY